MFDDMRYWHDRYSRGPRRGPAFQKGDLKYVILGLLKETPRHGYDIIRELEERSRGLYKPSPGVVYPTLQMLEEMGYAASREEEGKKVYAITEDGQKYLAGKEGPEKQVTDRIRKRWSFKNIGRMGSIMLEYHDIERLLSSSFRSLDEEKAERIHEILSRTYQDIELAISGQ